MSLDCLNIRDAKLEETGFENVMFFGCPVRGEKKD